MELLSANLAIHMDIALLEKVQPVHYQVAKITYLD